jgi:hypothetical protein
MGNRLNLVCRSANGPPPLFSDTKGFTVFSDLYLLDFNDLTKPELDKVRGRRRIHLSVLCLGERSRFT